VHNHFLPSAILFFMKLTEEEAIKKRAEILQLRKEYKKMPLRVIAEKLKTTYNFVQVCSRNLLLFSCFLFLSCPLFFVVFPVRIFQRTLHPQSHVQKRIGRPRLTDVVDDRRIVRAMKLHGLTAREVNGIKI
jgi:hypothetical protein